MTDNGEKSTVPVPEGMKIAQPGDEIPAGLVRKEYLTKDELRAVEWIGMIHSFILEKIMGKGPAAYGDTIELTHLIHRLQHMVMAQAAARAYPRLFRLMGEGTLPEEEQEPPAEEAAADGEG